MNRVVITGHRGFVGTHLRRVLQERGDKVTGLDLVEGDDVRYCHLPDADRVYHLAAQTSAQSEDYLLNIDLNVTASVRLFNRYKERVVFASSSMINYPICPYAITKAAAEHFARMHGCAVVRFCNLYGAGGHSVVDVFKNSPTVTIRGSGEQLRTYAPVHEAIYALLAVQPGELRILRGEDMTVNRIATALGSCRPITREPAHKYDIVDGRQIVEK